MNNTNKKVIEKCENCKDTTSQLCNLCINKKFTPSSEKKCMCDCHKPKITYGMHSDINCDGYCGMTFDLRSENETTFRIGGTNPPSPQPSSWEKEFDDKFGANKIWVVPSRENVENISEMKSFISFLLLQAQTEERRRIVGEIKRQMLDYSKGYKTSRNILVGLRDKDIFNEAMEFIINLINK